MRLINTTTLELETFISSTAVPRYAILSHTWGEGELSLQDFSEPTGRQKQPGFKKIHYTCHEALMNGIPYAWVDTVCIDKTSSAELSEAINSMWTWYKDAQVCYVYLSDMSYEDIVNARTTSDLDDPTSGGSLPSSRWVTRGWTLQELLAPREVEFYTADWQAFGTRYSLAPALSHHTKIDVDVLRGQTNMHTTSVAKRMSWASGRSTTRLEDAAYCLLGIFDVNMPLLYGEGEMAFIRLQEEILRSSDDESIFAWKDPNASMTDICGLLAPSPSMFQDSADIITYRDWSRPPVPASVSSVGITLLVRLQAYHHNYAAQIRCRRKASGADVGFYVQRISQKSGQYCRISPNTLFDWQIGVPSTELESISIRQKPVEPTIHDILAPDRWYCRRAKYEVLGAYTYQVVHSCDRQGEPAAKMDTILTIPGGINELGHIFVVKPESGFGNFLVLVGSRHACYPKRMCRMGAFEVRSLPSVGLSSGASLTAIVDHRDTIAALYNPKHYFDEIALFKGVHHITIATATERISSLPCCHLEFYHVNPEHFR